MNAVLFSSRASATRAVFGCNSYLVPILCSASLSTRSTEGPSALALNSISPRTWTRYRSKPWSNIACFYQINGPTKLDTGRTGARLFGTNTGSGSEICENSDGNMSVPRDGCEKSPFVVGHDSAQKMFYVELQEKSKNKASMAKLEYEWVRPGLVDLYHTETPPAFQGQGIAKVLVLAGLDHFCEQDVLIRPTCTYVQKVLKENLTSRYKDHVEESYLKSLL